MGCWLGRGEVDGEEVVAPFGDGALFGFGFLGELDSVFGEGGQGALGDVV